jgi:hypothetical protein
MQIVFAAGGLDFIPDFAVGVVVAVFVDIV